MLSTFVDWCLHHVGCTRTVHYNSAIFAQQCYRYELTQYRKYLRSLAEATPHTNIEEEINDILDTYAEISRDAIADIYSADS
jgi:hypothetical protein